MTIYSLEQVFAFNATNGEGGHPALDAKMTAALEFDGVKVDSCGPATKIGIWSKALNATGRKILLEDCGTNGPNDFGTSAWEPPTIAQVSTIHLQR